MKQTFAAMLGVALAVQSAAATVCAPEKLVRIETQNVSPGVKAGSFAALPIVSYRLGNGKVRTEEQPDPESGQHQLMIIDAPNAWAINLISKSGDLAVDDDNPSIVHASVFSDLELPEAVQALEFGCEAQFIAAAGTTHERHETASGVGTKHSILTGKWKLTLVTREGNAKPLMAILSADGKVVGAIRYLSYQVLDSVPDDLFMPPADIKIKRRF